MRRSVLFLIALAPFIILIKRASSPKSQQVTTASDPAPLSDQKKSSGPSTSTNIRSSNTRPLVSASPSIISARPEDFTAQERSISQLRHLKNLMAAGLYGADQFSRMISSEEGLWLKVAYIQGAREAKWRGAEAEKGLHAILSFLERLNPRGSTDAMVRAAYHSSLQLLTDLNRQNDGVFDEILKDCYERSQNPDYLKTIVETPFKIERLKSLPRAVATTIVRESSTAEFLPFARHLRASEDLSTEDRNTLEKYIHEHAKSSEWHIGRRDTNRTVLMKLNGVSNSDEEGKSQFIYTQWWRLFFSRLRENITREKRMSLPNPTYELASALWTDSDTQAQHKVQKQLMALFRRYRSVDEPLVASAKETALTNLAVAYLDICLSEMVPQKCREELSRQDSFATSLAREFLAPYLARPDASQALGATRAYVEKTLRLPL